MTKVRFEQSGPVGSIVLADPPHNAIDRQFVTELADAARQAGEAGVRALVLRAEGPNFSTGADAMQWPGKDRFWFRTFVAETLQAFAAIEALRIPVIAALRGPLLGGSYELALRADILVASETATFSWIEAGSGNTLMAGGVQRLAARVGFARAGAQLLLDQTLTARQAEEIGLVYQVVPDDQLDATVDALAQRLGNGGTRGLAATRALLKAWAAGGVAGADAVQMDLSVDLFDSADLQASIGTYVESLRTGTPFVPPVLTGR
ncbi:MULTISPECIES: enoyl-CoA hydratase/isomerase family protein [Actinoplanes]|uniref:enoyl-CoA hydratase/isomerase family protein n=1 Tax=Actinoplanes TaxID=1865 RepID=UPI0005F28208|nr:MULTISPECIES: enoyl-CoA hydratase/isomerase family protein [Actinoplanes]GLY03047.1 enoyl-CoA hydratase [Actinoplanes sp. NBRC 101535]